MSNAIWRTDNVRLKRRSNYPCTYEFIQHHRWLWRGILTFFSAVRLYRHVLILSKFNGCNR